MTTTLLTQLGLIPATMIILAGIIILYSSPEDKAGHRFLLFMLVMSVLLSLAILVAAWLTPEMDNRPIFLVSGLLTPALLGVLAIILVNLKRLVATSPAQKKLALSLGLALLALLAGLWREPFGMSQYILIGALPLAAVWLIGGYSEIIVTTLSLATMAMLVLFNQEIFIGSARQLPEWLSLLIRVAFYLLPGLVVGLAGVLVYTAIRRLPQPEDGGQGGQNRRSWVPFFSRLGVAILLLGYLAYTIYWASIWDQTSDGLAGLFLMSPASLVAIGAGMLMALATRGWRRVAGAVFAVLVPILLIQAFGLGWDVSYHAITEGRAARIQRALESYNERNGQYPASLDELVPGDLLFIQTPVILRGEGWCYQGGQDYYRLGSLYREYFGTPLSIKIYATQGEPPETGWECDERLAEMKLRYAPQPMAEEIASAPTQMPLPTSVIPVEKHLLEPVVKDETIFPGSWSPDGRYWLFSLSSTVQDQRFTSLHLLDADSGQVCATGGDFLEINPFGSELRDRHAWLPDGSLLFVSQEGEVARLKPCETDVENLTDHYPVRFEQVSASDSQSGRVLLKSAESYSVLDGESLEARRIDGVTPNPYEFHWDHYAWLPGGNRLAISRLNGRDGKAGSILYVVDGESLEVLNRLPMDYASDQSAPMVEWLDEGQLLLNGASVLAIVDLKSDPPRLIDVMRDIFNLDLDVPDEISSMADIVDKDEKGYHLAVWANHPRNQGLYLYHSENGSVEVLHPEANVLLFFPDGQWEQLTKVEDEPTYQDVYELIWVDMPAKVSRRLVVQGHTPRSYPHLWVRYLPGSSQIAFSSSQGVSLLSFPDGEMLDFWELAGNRDAYLLASPRGDTFVAVADGYGLFYVPIK